MTYQLTPISDLRPSPTNPRKHFDKERIDELAESIMSVGLLEPLLCVSRGDHYEVVAGECRLRAANRAGITELPCVVREMSQREIIAAQMAENIARSSLNPMEEADGLAAMMELGELDEQAVARSLGTTRKWVQSRLALTGLPERAREAVRVSAMSITVAQEILDLDEAEMEEATEMLLDFGDDLTGAQARLQLRERYREPRRRREAWAKVWELELAEKYGDIAEPIEDCELWASYLRPYGEPFGRWVDGAEPIGAAAADQINAGITWRELAKALGIKGLLVPLRGNGQNFLIYDRSKIEAAEKAARENGQPFTLGPRQRGGVDPAPDPEPPADEPDPDDGTNAQPDVPIEELNQDALIDLIIDKYQCIDDSEVLGVIEYLLYELPGEVEQLMERIGLGDLIARLIEIQNEEAE